MGLARREVVGVVLLVLGVSVLVALRPVVQALSPELASQVPAWEYRLLGGQPGDPPPPFERVLGGGVALLGWLVGFRPRAPRDPRLGVEVLRVLLLASLPAVWLWEETEGASAAAELPFVAFPEVAVGGSTALAALLLAAWIRAAPTVLEPVEGPPVRSDHSGGGRGEA